jgi:hypothetical protein
MENGGGIFQQEIADEGLDAVLAGDFDEWNYSWVQ